MEMLIHKKEWGKFIKWVIISGTVILVPMIWVDSMYYGKLVIAPLNIIIYNVFTNHGPNIYGTEPFSYYIYNGFLNFNFVFIGALWAPFGLVIFIKSKFEVNNLKSTINNILMNFTVFSVANCTS